MIGPLQRSRKGNKYILVLCDYATRFPAPTTHKPMASLKDSTGHWKACYGGVASATNPTETNTSLWSCLPIVRFAYREVLQQSLGFSPFEILYIAILFKARLSSSSHRWLKAQKPTWRWTQQSMSLTWVTGCVTLLRLFRRTWWKHNSWYDKNSWAREFETGQQVLVLLSSSTSKFKAAWQGPYQVEERLSGTTYRVKLSCRRKGSKVYHVNLLRPRYQRGRLTYYAALVDKYEELSQAVHEHPVMASRRRKECCEWTQITIVCGCVHHCMCDAWLM